MGGSYSRKIWQITSQCLNTVMVNKSVWILMTHDAVNSKMLCTVLSNYKIEYI